MTSATERYQQAREAYEAVKADRTSHPEAVQTAWNAVCEAWPGMVEEQHKAMDEKKAKA